MFQVRAIQSNEIEAGLTLLLDDKRMSQLELDDKIEQFKQLAEKESYDLSRQVVVCQDDHLIYSCLYVLSPGNTAFLYSASPLGFDDKQMGAAVSALKQLIDTASHDASLLEVVLPPEENYLPTLYQQAGFRFLTTLSYMVRYTPAFSAENPTPPMGEWIPYQQDIHDLFKETIQNSYRDSLDCPELEHIRDMEDVIKSHKAAGQFQPNLWNLLSVDDGKTPVGAILLSPLTGGDIMELVYMGLVPEARGKGYGKHCLDYAIEQTENFGAATLLLAVDERNHPARKLYERAGFQSLFDRVVYYWSSHWD